MFKSDDDKLKHCSLDYRLFSFIHPALREINRPDITMSATLTSQTHSHSKFTVFYDGYEFRMFGNAKEDEFLRSLQELQSYRLDL